jgi:PAS domain S-box-containing protein
MLRHGKAVSRQHWVVQPEHGKAHTMQFSAAPVRDAAGRIACGILVWGELPAPGSPDEARYQALVEAGALAVWTANPDGALKHIDGWLALTGQSDAEAAGLGWLDAVHPEDRAMVRDRWVAAIAGGTPYEVEYRLRQGSGRHRWTAARAVPLRNPDGIITQWIGVNTDIEARKQAELALRHSEARFRTLAEAMPHLVWQTDTLGEPDYVNPRWLAVTGLDLAGLRGGGWLAALHPDDRPTLAAAWVRVLRDGGDYDADARIRGADGVYRWYRVKAAPVHDTTGAIRHWVGTCTDVDERHLAEARLREALAARERLAREADHRIKNSLQLVAALLRLQAGRMTEPAGREALEATTARVQAVAEAHRALQLSPDLLSVRLPDMLRELATGAASQHPAADIRISAPEGLTLDAERAIPLALILSELVTNALRHAYPAGRPGPVQLSARLEDGAILVEVADAGTGAPEGAVDSMGDTVIRALAGQIRAEVVTESSPCGGTRVTVQLAPDPAD